MASRSSDGPDLFFPARGLSLAGLVLVALYLSILAGVFFPIQLLNPAWQLKLGSALINASPFPLIGLGAMHLARVLAPADRLLRSRSRSRLAARLAVALAVALGFLLLIPLLSWAAISEQQQRVSSQASLIARANANLKALRQVVASARSGQEQRERLIGAGGPVLDAQAPARPLPALRAEVNGLLDQTAAQVARQQQLLPNANPLHPGGSHPPAARLDAALEAPPICTRSATGPRSRSSGSPDGGRESAAGGGLQAWHCWSSGKSGLANVQSGSATRGRRLQRTAQASTGPRWRNRVLMAGAAPEGRLSPGGAGHGPISPSPSKMSSGSGPWRLPCRRSPRGTPS
jgi:hypothetical protein